MRAMNKVSLPKANKNLVFVQSKNLHKTARATYYNLRLYYSNLRRNESGYSKWDTVHGPEGFEKVQIHNLDKN
jgi:hypothetical protein